MFDAKKEVDEVREIICFAFRISEMESESKVDGNENGNRGPQEVSIFYCVFCFKTFNFINY